MNQTIAYDQQWVTRRERPTGCEALLSCEPDREQTIVRNAKLRGVA